MDDWQTFTVDFSVTNPGIQYIAIGNFYEPESFYFEPTGTGNTSGAYYYIDRIEIMDRSTAIYDDLSAPTAKPIKYIDFNGNEIKEPKNGLYIEIYEDGSTRKVFRQ